eukprot:5326575-Prymnesium_polylepis.1
MGGASTVQRGADSASASTQSAPSSGLGYSASQATGVSNVAPSCGTHSLAWSPLQGTDTPQWLRVGFATPVYATLIEIFETSSAPFVTSVEAIDPAGHSTKVFSGPDATSCGSALTVSLPGTSSDREVVIHTVSAGRD